MSRRQVRHYAAAGVGGAAIIGVRLLLAAVPDTDPVPEIGLVSFDSVLVPLAPKAQDEWWVSKGGLFGGGASPTPNSLAAASTSAPASGPVFMLFGDGLDAPADCTGAACNGGDAARRSRWEVPSATAATSFAPGVWAMTEKLGEKHVVRH